LALGEPFSLPLYELENSPVR